MTVIRRPPSTFLKIQDGGEAPIYISSLQALMLSTKGKMGVLALRSILFRLTLAPRYRAPRWPIRLLGSRPDSPELNGYPASRYYDGLFYMGRFVEAGRVPELRDTRAETPIVFQTYEQQAEPELPELL